MPNLRPNDYSVDYIYMCVCVCVCMCVCIYIYMYIYIYLKKIGGKVDKSKTYSGFSSNITFFNQGFLNC